MTSTQGSLFTGQQVPNIGIFSSASPPPNSFMTNPSSFPSTNNQQGFGINSFNQQQQQGQTGSAFSFGGYNNQNNTSGNQSGPFFSGQQQLNNMGGIFGNVQNQQNTSIFASSVPSMTKTNAGIFGNTINPTTNNQTIFGTPNTNNSIGNNSLFGNNNTTNTGIIFNNHPPNTLSGNFMTPFSGGGSTTNQPPTFTKFIPNKPRNMKLDSKHLVKCITELPQNIDYCLKQLRMKFIQNCQQGTLGSINSNTNTFNFTSLNHNNQQMGLGFINQNTQSNLKQNYSPFGNISNNTNPFQFLQNNQNFTTSGPLLNANNQNNTNFQNVSTAIFTGGANQSLFNPNPFGNQTANYNNQPPQQQYNSPFVTNNPVNNNNNNLTFNTMAMQMANQSMHQNFLNQPISNPLLMPNNPNTSYPSTQTYHFLASLLNLANQNSKQVSTITSIYNFFAPLLNSTVQDPNLAHQTYQFLYSLLNSSANQNAPLDYHNQIMILNAFLNSDLFKKLINNLQNKKNGPFDQLTSHSNTVRTSISQFSDEDFYQESKEYSYDNKKVRKTSDYYRTPFIFKQTSSADIKSKNLPIINSKDTFDIKTIKPTKPKPKTELMLKKTPLDDFQECYDKYKKKTLKQIIAKPEDLPFNDTGYTLTPNIQKLSQMTQKQLKNVYNVSIENQYGYIKFKEPISLFRKKISQCIQISQDSIQVQDNQWTGKRCQLHYKNFSQYKDGNDSIKKKIVKKMNKWTQKNKMNILYFDYITGDLTIDLCC